MEEVIAEKKSKLIFKDIKYRTKRDLKRAIVLDLMNEEFLDKMLEGREDKESLKSFLIENGFEFSKKFEELRKVVFSRGDLI